MLVLKELSQSSNQVLLHLQEDDTKAVCPVYYKPDYFGMIIGIAGGIVRVGMLTILLWKAFTTVTDRREFARWISRPAQNCSFTPLSNPPPGSRRSGR